MYKVSEQTKSDVVIYASQGLKIDEICAITNLTRYKVAQIMHENGIQGKRGVKPLAITTQKGKAVALWQNGLENPELIAQKIGCTRERVVYYLDICGIKTRQKLKPIDIDIINLMEEYKGRELPRGVFSGIAQKHGVSRQAVGHHIAKLKKRGDIK